jgi:hypothetical protein
VTTSSTHTDRIVRAILADQPERRPCIEVVDDVMAAVLRDKSSAERLEIAYGMWRFARDTIRRAVAAQHPRWLDEEVKREATRRLVHGAG